MSLLSWLLNHPSPRLEALEARTVPTTIQGVVYADLNGTGSRDPGEPGLVGWTVFKDVNR